MDLAEALDELLEKGLSLLGQLVEEALRAEDAEAYREAVKAISELVEAQAIISELRRALGPRKPSRRPKKHLMAPPPAEGMEILVGAGMEKLYELKALTEQALKKGDTAEYARLMRLFLQLLRANCSLLLAAWRMGTGAGADLAKMMAEVKKHTRQEGRG